jgi:hypothetical protein
LFGRPLRYCQFCLLILEGQLADRQFRDALLERARDYTEAVDRRRYERSQDA